MGRIFWMGLSEDRLPDGRLLLNVDFKEKGNGKTYRWAPKWAEMLELTRRAYDVEVANETGSPYEPALRAARELYSAESAVAFSPPDMNRQVFCYECGWHAAGVCCDWCRCEPRMHQ